MFSVANLCWALSGLGWGGAKVSYSSIPTGSVCVCVCVCVRACVCMCVWSVKATHTFTLPHFLNNV